MTKSEWEELQKRLGIKAFGVHYENLSVGEAEESFKRLFEEEDKAYIKEIKS